MPKNTSLPKHATMVGAGPVGSLFSIYLAKRGVKVDLYERRPDMREEPIGAGRSINVAVSTRGLYALRQAGLEGEVLKRAIPMRGRMMHAVSGELTFQRYGRDDSECINSVSRGELNKTLMTAAEKNGVAIHFNQRATGIDFDKMEVTLGDARGGEASRIHSDVVLGTDGSASAIRHEMMQRPGYSSTETELEYGYKELTIPPGSGGSFLLDKHALHIWPRGTYMLIALPNWDGSFTCTLFLPFKGAFPSFEGLKAETDVLRFFQGQFPDALSLMPDLAENFFGNPTGHMLTVKCTPWNVEDKALLLGDAAHAIVPFFGQGMNCGFEDCSIFDELCAKRTDWRDLFSTFSAARKSDTDAIADMAVENFTEMRDKVADPKFLLEKKVEAILQEKFPGQYISRYRLVTFTRAPYRLALEAGVRQAQILSELCRGIADPGQLDLKKAEQLIRQKLSGLQPPYE